MDRRSKAIERIESERHNLSKLLIEARTRIVELEEGIQAIIDSGNKMMSFSIEKRLKKLVEKEKGG